MSLVKYIENRRAIYPIEFTGEKISKSVIMELLHNAHWAPSHGNTTPWLFKVFTGESLIALVDKMISFHNKNKDQEVRRQKAEKLQKYKKQCSHIIAICVRPSGNHPSIEDSNAVSCAVQNMWLTLGNHDDIGGYWSTGNGTYTKDMDDFLNLDGGSYCIGFFLLGKVDSKRTESRRPPLDNHVEWVE